MTSKITPNLSNLRVKFKKAPYDTCLEVPDVKVVLGGRLPDGARESLKEHGYRLREAQTLVERNERGMPDGLPEGLREEIVRLNHEICLRMLTMRRLVLAAVLAEVRP